MPMISVMGINLQQHLNVYLSYRQLSFLGCFIYGKNTNVR